MLYEVITDLKDYLEMRERAEANDHNKLGRELDLFVTDKRVGKGLPLLTPRGSTLKRTLIRFVEDEELSRGYEYTTTPFMANKELYQVSGHWDLYKDGMFIRITSYNVCYTKLLRADHGKIKS